MAKVKEKPATPDIDATPERMAQADMAAGKICGAHGIGEATPDIDPVTGQRKLGKARRFRDSRVDMLYSTWGAITWPQWYAATWWRERVEVGMGTGRLCADYGQSMGGGSVDPSPLPLSDKAERARVELSAAKKAISLKHRAAIEEVIDDPHDTLTGRASMARLNRWREGLSALAAYLRVNPA